MILDRKAAAIVSVLLLAAITACGGSTGGGTTPKVVTTPTINVTVPDSLGPCDELAGLPTEDILNVGLCNDGDTQQILITAFQDCTDARDLHWNDFGWGYDGGTWHSHHRADGQLVPPDVEMARCRP